jgi:hypothetical protein
MDFVEIKDITKPEIYLRVKEENVLKLMEYLFKNQLYFTYKPWEWLDESDEEVIYHQFYLMKEDFDKHIDNINKI